MGSDYPEVPEPFRYSRAHSWPQPPGQGASPPPPQQLPPARGRLIALVAAAAVLGLLVSGIVVEVFLGGDDPVAVSAPPPATVLPSLLPEPPDRVVPQAGVPRPTASTKSATPTPKPTTAPPTTPPPPSGPKPPTGPLAGYLLELADVRNFGPGTWGVQLNSITRPIARREQLVACSGRGTLAPHLDRHFKLPTGGGTFDEDGPRVIQRLVRYDSGSAGAKAVQGYRKVIATCPTRRTSGYVERWTIIQDTRSDTGDVLHIRRLPEPKVPQAGKDFGNDYVIVRNRDVVLLIDFRARSNVRLDTAQTRLLIRAVTARLCGGQTC